MFDIFSRRARRDAGKGPDAYSYDRLPEPLKVQVIHSTAANILLLAEREKQLP